MSRAARPLGADAPGVQRLLGILVAAAAMLIGPAAATADAQIVNTLRRWSDAEPGWTGDLEARFSLASGNTEYLEFAGGASLQFVRQRHRVRGFTNACAPEACTGLTMLTNGRRFVGDDAPPVNPGRPPESP